MQVTILDKKKIGPKTWVLCKCSLLEYLTNLKKDFYNYQIQRRIVKNVYLDGICNTIVAGEPIPPFTITVDYGDFSQKGENLELNLGNCEILDGLQRTFRLWTILDFHRIIIENHLQSPKDFVVYMRRQGDFGEMILGLDFISTSFLKLLFDESYFTRLMDAFRKFDILLVVWAGLSSEDVVKKMLLLNAGQRPVSSTHQYELLFLHIFDGSKISVPEVTLLRERDLHYFSVKKGDRNVGEYTMSSIIIALQSLIEKKPLRVAPANLIQWDTDALFDFDILKLYFNPDFITGFLLCIHDMDVELAQRNAEYVKWFGKDTTLSGIFAGLGTTIWGNGNILDKCVEFVARLKNDKLDFRLDEFNKEYDALASTKVNVGNVVRRAIAFYTEKLIMSGTAFWDESFKSVIRR
ncbi:MAG: hypothetical protein KBT27_05035 [Prevotellaceae bacterium]|nr:hypothetical protein [Candidatus Faecinaster equi]